MRWNSYIFGTLRNFMSIGRRIYIIGFCLIISHGLFAYVPDSVSDTKKVIDFNILKIKGNFNVFITQGKTCSLKVVAPDKTAMDGVEVKAGTTLNIDTKEGVKSGATLYITVKNDIAQIAINTNGTVSSTNTISGDGLNLNIDGDASVNLSVDAKQLMYTSNSSKPTVIKGKAKTCVLNDSGDGSIDASGLKIKTLNADDSSDGELKVDADEIHLKIGGTGAFTYSGKPSIKDFKLHGQADAKQINQASK